MTLKRFADWPERSSFRKRAEPSSCNYDFICRWHFHHNRRPLVVTFLHFRCVKFKLVFNRENSTKITFVNVKVFVWLLTSDNGLNRFIIIVMFNFSIKNIELYRLHCLLKPSGKHHTRNLYTQINSILTCALNSAKDTI